jgi:hypothetical protein
MVHPLCVPMKTLGGSNPPPEVQQAQGISENRFKRGAIDCLERDALHSQLRGRRPRQMPNEKRQRLMRGGKGVTNRVFCGSEESRCFI